MTVTVAHYQYERVDEWLRTCLPGATRNDALTEACAKTSFVAKVIRITGAESPEELPAYTAVRAAQIVRLSPSTLRLWASGDGEHNALFAPALDFIVQPVAASRARGNSQSSGSHIGQPI